MPESSSSGAAGTPHNVSGEALHGHLATITRLLLDDVALSAIDRLRLARELASIRAAMAKSPTTLERLHLARRLADVRKKLGSAQRPAANSGELQEDPFADPADAIAEGKAERASTASFYDYDPNRKPAQRRRENVEAMAILAAIDNGSLDPAKLTDDQRAALARYSGTGGNLVGADGKKGSAYEYYTPKPIAEGMWALMRELGFSGGRVLDPSAGVGIFGATAPVNAAVDAVELNETSGRVNQLVNDGPGYKTTIAPFEAVASATPDEVYDAVITNVPFGEVNDRGGNQYKDTKYRQEPLQNYFILRSLEKLRPGGLAAFITPPRVVSGKGGKEEDLRLRVSYMAEFMGAYRLPNSVFGTAAADTITDVIVFRKFSRDVITKIEELREQNPQVLVDANVVWGEFVNGTYFMGDGRRFILGEFQAKDPNKFRDVDRVLNDASMADIARLMRKFPDSRIKWDLLEATETTPIVYRDGDTMNHAGQTLEMRDGRWVVIKAAGGEEAAADLAEQLSRLTTALGAVNAGVSYAAAERVQTALVEAARALEVPDWLRGLLAQLARVPAGQREAAWNAAIVGLAINEAISERQAEETGFNYEEGYPILSEAMKRVAADAKRPPSALSSSIKTAMKAVGVHYSKAGGFSGVWRGDVATTSDTRDTAQKFEAARYQAGGGAFVPLAEAQAVYGSEFDPMGDDEWCVSADGQGVARADDYYVGNYADFLARIEADLKAAASDGVRDKLLRQKMQAESRLLRSDPSSMHFTLFSPFTTMEERAEFVRRFVDPRFSVHFDEKTGEPYIECDIGTPKSEAERNLKRFAEYLRSGKVSTRTAKEDRESNPALEKARIAALRALVQTSEAQFNSWAKSNPVIMGRLQDLANDPQRLYFRQVEDDSPLNIPGLNPDWTTHGYQAAWVRKMGREFGGINGDGVGLGKTSQGLIAAQHAISIGTKKRVMFVVPNSVLSNWRKEAKRVYASIDDCLFVGLRESGGKLKTDPSAYDADLTRVLEGRHSKIFVTYEAFQRLRLRATTAEQYDAYLASVDETYATSDLKKRDEKSKSLRAKVIEQLTTSAAKSMAAPFFEDLGLDALVIDEAHMLKNSRGTVEFTGGKFLSLADPSARGLDAQAKAWFVRKDAPRKDGVILLTATPITNSPLEIYSMLALAVGDQKLNDLMVGIKGADQFMEVMCQLESRDEETLDGLIKPYDVFVGLNNVGMLRTALAATSTIRTAEQVGEQIVMPDSEEKPTPVDLPESAKNSLLEYKEAFRFAIDTIMEKKEVRGSQEAYERVAARFGEPMELIGHPFNLIQKMSLLIADPELDERATFFTFTPPMAEKVQQLVGQWNAKAPIEDRPRMSPHTSNDAVVGKKIVRDGENESELLRIQARAKIVGTRVVLDSMDSENQAAFDAMADKLGVDFDMTVPPKLAALIANYQHEEANPRGRVRGADGEVIASGRVRQLVFCDVLAMHIKIKRLLQKHCGIPAGSIAIVTGRVNGKPEDILAVQDGFNAEGDDNKYRCIIANEKAEVGINLQKGTQAIHHLTLGWTPDSLTQRNGRGARQGNETKSVRIYHYDADGTFDSYKRMLVGKKSNWIDAIMDPNGGDTVAVTGGLTREQLESLIDSVGDSDAMSRIQARAEAADKLARAASTQGKQTVNLVTIKSQREFMARYDNAVKWAAEKVAAYFNVRGQVSLVEGRLANPKATAGSIVKNQGLLAELQAREAGLRRSITDSVVIKRRQGYRGDAEPATLDDFAQYVITRSYGDLKKLSYGDRAIKIMRDGGSGFEFEVSETSDIGNEWRSEIDQAQAMVDSSRKDFEKLAGQEGGISITVLERADAGNSTVVDGKVVCTGAFVERSGFLGVVRRNRSGAFMVHYADEQGRTKALALADEMRKAVVTLPGSPGYDALLTRAATIEEAIGETGQLPASSLDLLFSSEVPEVAQRRTKPLLVRYPVKMWDLPAPYFPRVVPTGEDMPAGAVVLPLLAQQQAKVVHSTTEEYGTLYFTADSSVAVKEKESDFSWAALMDFAKSRGVKITHADFKALAHWGDTPARQLSNPNRPEFNKAVIEGAASVGDLAQRLESWLVNDAFPQYELSTDPEFKGGPEAFLSAFAYGLSAPYQRAKANLEAIAAAQARGDTPPEVEKVPDAVDTSDPNRIVGISGNTRAWKDQIKEIARVAGGRAIWDGDAGMWNVPAKAWVLLNERFPRTVTELQAVESSGKTGYGRRR